MSALIYPEVWPVCPEGCVDALLDPKRCDLLVTRSVGSVRATLHCSECGWEGPAHRHGFKAAAAVASREGRGVVVG